MLVIAALAVLVAANGPPGPAARIIPVLSAAIKAAPQSASPSPSAVRRTLGSELYQQPKRSSDLDTEWIRFTSADESCSVELGPIVRGRVMKLTASCRYATRDTAIEFLHDMVRATESDWQPPVFFSLDGEIAHVAIIVKDQSPITAEAYLQHEEAGTWRAAVVIAVGGRSVVPAR